MDIKFSNFVFLFLVSLNCFSQDTFIHVDQFGYHTTATKTAVLRNPQVGFNASESYTAPTTLQLINTSNNQVVFTGNTQVWNNGNTDLTSGDKGWWFDFSSFTTPGEYYIKDVTNGINSDIFTISTTPYIEVLKVASKMFYYNRCNFSKTTPYADIKWTDGTNFNNPLQDYNTRYIFDKTNASLEKDLSGGWFDAGDYNKYVTFTYSTIHNLLKAYENNPTIFTDNFNIPESGNGIPDILDEIKYELDWIYKMTNSDGSVHIKMGSQNYSENTNSPPSANTDPRYYGVTCTSASVTVASIFAHAAIVFQSIPSLSTYADQLQDRAITCYNYALPFFNNGTLETNCDNGEIISGDADKSVDGQKECLLSASVYLFKLTNNTTYNQFLITNASSLEPLSTNSWTPYKISLIDALLYYTSLPNANNTLKNDIITSANNDVTNNYNNYYGFTTNTLYRDFMPTWSYHWGSNNVKATYGCLNVAMANYGIGNTADLYLKSEEIMHSFHGVNPLGMVQLSNMYNYGAEKSANEIYHTWFFDGTVYDNALTSTNGPAPGYVVGGANKDFTITTLSPPYGQPDSKSYLDFNTSYPQNSWEITEPAIYYQAAYIRMLAEIMNYRETLSNENFLLSQQKINIHPNPSKNIFIVNSKSRIDSIELLNITGEIILKQTNINSFTFECKLENNPNGIYFLKVNCENGIQNLKIIKE
ncbi:glycoside hydrolase family 9 protein [Flavobacterium sp. HNIBRBA15423]|uniref:glycoside hydrolase family 9 protein n=1 Tax=Flavobacterium sp. HNIBRBA15423 TaxID=3458683 RepID=UPI004044FFDA